MENENLPGQHPEDADLYPIKTASVESNVTPSSLSVENSIFNDSPELCKNCGFAGNGSYCSECGQTYRSKRITVKNLLHDIFHLFTHLDKGFGYTLKQLIANPGDMQRDYIKGNRSRYQKPFSMFFICATIAALGRYWIFRTVDTYYQSGDLNEANFFHEYMVILHIILLPVNALITWLFFYRSGYNYAETGVLYLYTVSIFFLMSILISLLKFIWPEFDSAYIELPTVLVYNAVTFIRFFKFENKWKVAMKSTIVIILIFMLVQITEDVLLQTFF